MDAKIVLFAFIAVFAVVNGADCDCKDVGETKELWHFLAKLSTNVDKLDDNEKEMYSVLPGQLSPLFECNCLDKSRRKRETEDIGESAQEKVERVRALRQRKSIRFGTRLCPTGYAQVGYLCVKEEYLD